MTRVAPKHIIKVNDIDSVGADDLLAVEEPLEIRLGFGDPASREQRSLAVTMRTPGHDFELTLGFLFTEGIIHSMQDVMDIQYCTDLGRQETENVVRVELHPHVAVDFQKLQRHVYTTSSCGVCGKASLEAVQQQCSVITSSVSILATIIQQLPLTLEQEQTTFKHTGGLHASGIFSIAGELLLLREDVGRHNALDKVIGAYVMRNKIPMHATLLLVSGRASFELVQKAAMAGIPVLAAVGAPSSLAVELAQQTGMTLIGFLRNNRFNIYSGSERIVV